MFFKLLVNHLLQMVNRLKTESSLVFTPSSLMNTLYSFSINCSLEFTPLPIAKNSSSISYDINYSQVFFFLFIYPFIVFFFNTKLKLFLSLILHFSSVSCQITPIKSFLIIIRLILPIQNIKSSPKFNIPKSKP